MGYLLMTRVSLDAQWGKQVSDFKMALHWNEAKATEAIEEAKIHCGVASREAEAHHATLVREAEAHHTTLIREAEHDCATIIAEVEDHCTTDIRKAEYHCVENACSIQQLHSEDM